MSNADALAFWPFREVWAVDFEYLADPGECPSPLCMVATEVRTQRTLRLWQDDLYGMPAAPFDVGDGALLIAYYASAECGAFLALGWELPVHVLDLYAEFSKWTNGYPRPFGRGLLGAARSVGIPAMVADVKEAARRRILAGGPFSVEERSRILDYCLEDVATTAALLQALASRVDLPRALIHGRYMKAVARMERVGIPIDTSLLYRLREHRSALITRLIADLNETIPVYDGTAFRHARFETYLAAHRIPWPRLGSGQLCLDDDTFKDMGRRYPAVAPLATTRALLSKLSKEDLTVGGDGRNRRLLSPFGSKTGRNQPSSTQFAFGLPRMYRHLIRPSEGSSLGYVDWGQQEFGIAAALSGDMKMQAAYCSGDPYLAFAIQAGLAPPHATKTTHKDIRDLSKGVVLGVQYGMSDHGLARQLGVSRLEATHLLQRHRETYSTFWHWSDRVAVTADLTRRISTVFGWTMTLVGEVSDRTIRNFPMQANGAEMLRLACIDATESGIDVCAPVHDAVLIQAPTATIGLVVERMQECMARASRIVLNGFELRTDFRLVHWPESLSDETTARDWLRLTTLLAEIKELGGTYADR